MSEPKLSESDIADIEQQAADYNEVMLDKRTAKLLIAEVRATRLSAEDIEALTWARGRVPTSYETPCTMCHDSTWDHVCDDKTTAIPEAVRFVALLDRLIGRSAL